MYLNVRYVRYLRLDYLLVPYLPKVRSVHYLSIVRSKVAWRGI